MEAVLLIQSLGQQFGEMLFLLQRPSISKIELAAEHNAFYYTLNHQAEFSSVLCNLLIILTVELDSHFPTMRTGVLLLSVKICAIIHVFII